MTIDIPEGSIQVLKWSVANRLDAIFECVMDDYKKNPVKAIQYGKEEFLPVWELNLALKEQLGVDDLGTLYTDDDFQKAVDILNGSIDEDFMSFLKETYIPYEGSYEDLLSDIGAARKDWLETYDASERAEGMRKLKATTSLFLRTNRSKLPKSSL